MFLAGTLFSLGCGGSNASTAPVRILCQDDVTTAEVIQAAEDVLARMHFPIEKLDVEQGIIRTRPLRGAQFFEFWRSDNASSSACAEANLHSIRRSVEVRMVRSSQPAASGPLCIECDVSVQRLSLPGNEVAGVSEAYAIHSRSTPTLQRIELSPQQQHAMTWIDLGRDPDLAARILERIEKRLNP